MKLKGRRMLGTQWFLMGMDRNYRGIDENYREIDLIRGSHPPYIYIYIYIYRERERERERERDALMH